MPKVPNVQIAKSSGGFMDLNDDALQELQMAFAGPLLKPGDDAYERARVIYNGMFSRRPGLITQCSGTADVIDAVNFAAKNDLLVAVRGGGHSVAGHRPR